MRVFVSSSMDELASERKAIKEALDELKIEAWLFEVGAGARPETIKEVYQRELARADLYIGLFWKRYGAYTIDEFEYAQILDKDCLIYEKHTDLENRTPALQKFLDKIGAVQTGLTLNRFDSPEEVSTLVKQDVVQWLIRNSEEAKYKEPSPAETKRNRLKNLIEDVRLAWIEDKLTPSTKGMDLLDLAKTTRPDAVEHPIKLMLVQPDQNIETLPEGKPIYKVYDEKGPGMLILGGPGSGKTTTLLKLAEALLTRAKADGAAPIPVVLNLSTWTKDQSFEDWLVEMVNALSLRTKKTWIRPWLEDHRILPLLDGLDEVEPASQAACVEAINTFAEERGVPGLVVCSRLEDYAALPVRLRLRRAIYLQPLQHDQVMAYVTKATKAGASLEGLGHMLEKDPVMRKMAQSPLMLNVMSIAYQGKTVEALAGNNTVEARRRHTYDAYIERMFEHRITSYDEKQVAAWLSWLAEKMKAHGQSFFFIEKMQPSWLATDAQRWLYMLGSRLVGGLAVGLPLGLVAGLILLQISGNPIEDLLLGLKIGLVDMGLMVGLVVGLIDGWRLLRADRRSSGTKPSSWQRAIDVGAPALVIGLLAAMTSFVDELKDLPSMLLIGLLLGLLFVFKGRKKTLQRDIRTIEVLAWEGAEALRGGLRGLALGVGLGLLLGLALALLWTPGLIGIGVAVVLIGMIGGSIGTVYGGLHSSKDKEPEDDEEEDKTLQTDKKPKEPVTYHRIKLALRNVAVGGLAGSLVGALVLGLLGAFLAEDNTLLAGLGGAGLGALLFGFIAGLWYGGLDLLQHFVLRLILYVKGHTPGRYLPFLDAATALIFLRKKGGGYTFIHLSLRDHFAAPDE